MKETLTQWQRGRISQTLWKQNESRLGFRWFHEQGLPAPFVLDEVEIQVTPELSADILQLRLQAAQSDGRMQQVNDLERLRDEYDRDALHVKLILRDQLVACGRLVFIFGSRERSEINKALVALPDATLLDEGVVEISRVCTHPEYRRGLLLTYLLAECAWAAYARGGTALLGYCVKSLVPIYGRFAGEALPYSGRHALYEGRESFVMRINLEKVMRGEDVPFLAWARFIAPRLSEIPESFAPGWMLRAKAQGALLIKPCLNEVLKFMLPFSA